MIFFIFAGNNQREEISHAECYEISLESVRFLLPNKLLM